MTGLFRTLIAASVVASTLALNEMSNVSVERLDAAPVAAVVAAASTSASMNGQYCWFCSREEGSAVHPITLEWEDVVYAYCVEWPIAGGGTDCEEPPNAWNLDNEWEGDVCQLDHQGAPCDCTYEPLLPWPDDPLTIDDCPSEVPVAALAADGFITSIHVGPPEAEDFSSQTTCTGIVTALKLRDEGTKGSRVVSRLVL